VPEHSQRLQPSTPVQVMTELQPAMGGHASRPGQLGTTELLPLEPLELLELLLDGLPLLPPLLLLSPPIVQNQVPGFSQLHVSPFSYGQTRPTSEH
jgi:hypothetical protein